MPYEPIIPSGQQLGTSHEVDGAVTGHLFEDGKLKGHAAWQWVDEPEEDHSPDDEYEPPRQLTQEELELAAKIAAVIVIVIVAAVNEATPHIKRWWSEKALPTAKSAWRRIAGLRRNNDETPSSPLPTMTRSTFVASAAGVEVAVADSKIRMSRAEWESRFRSMLAADRFRNQQLQILSQSQIDDDSVVNASKNAEQLTPQQFAERIKSTLEANPSLLNEEASAELMRIFNGHPK